MELAEFLMKIIQIGAMCIALVVMIVNSMAFASNIETYANQKAAIDFSQAVLSDPCLVKEINGDGRKGVFDLDKLDGDLCVDIDGDYYVEINSGADKWEFGAEFDDGESVNVPGLVYYSGDKVNPAVVSVKVKVVE